MERTGMTEFRAVTVLLVLVAALLCVGIAASSMNIGTHEPEDRYLKMERQLAADVREMLKGEGLEDSGVMVTRTVEADGSRNYTVTVHHRDIGGMSEEERQQLLYQLETLDFEEEGCTFSHQFLLDD